MPVLKGRYQLNQLAESLKLQEFCKKHNLNLKSDSVFLEIQVLKRCNKTIHDVILLDVSCV
jgi:dephospho-CoA kinase